MSTQDQALFDQWLDKFATPEERALPFEKQLEMHICWLSGVGELALADMAITPEDRERPQ